MPPKSSVPSTEEIRHTLKATFEEHKKILVALGAVLVVVVVGVILYFTLSRRETEKHWDELLLVDRQPPLAAERTLESLLERGDADIAPHVLYKLAVLAARDKDYDRAIELLDHLQKDHGDTLFRTLPSPDRRFSLVDLLRRRIEAGKAWEEKHALETPEPDTERVALVETDQGDFWVGFYPEHAPKHVESFVRLAKSGALNGTKVYVVTPNRVEFGGEATKDDDPFNDTPTREDGLLDSEPGRFRIKQDRGALSTVAHDGGESPTRFAVVVGMSDLGLEKKQTVFGKVLTDRGTAMEALDEIKNVKTYGTVKDPAYDEDRYKKIPDHPVEPIVIERVSIWSGDAIEDGHEWDTAAVTPPEKQKITKPEEKEGPGEDQKGEDEQEPAEEKSDESDAGEKKGDSPTEPDEEKNN